MLWQLPFSFNKKEPILKTSLIFLNFIDPGLLQFNAKDVNVWESQDLDL